LGLVFLGTSISFHSPLFAMPLSLWDSVLDERTFPMSELLLPSTLPLGFAPWLLILSGFKTLFHSPSSPFYDLSPLKDRVLRSIRGFRSNSFFFPRVENLLSPRSIVACWRDLVVDLGIFPPGSLLFSFSSRAQGHGDQKKGPPFVYLFAIPQALFSSRGTFF